MTGEHDVVARAHAEARERVAAGGGPGGEPPAWDRVVLAPGGPPSELDLVRWATVEPDADQVRSTRRLGRPITLLKRGLLRLLGQYHADLLGQQVRYNQHLALLASALQDRVDALEARVRELDGRDAADPTGTASTPTPRASAAPEERSGRPTGGPGATSAAAGRSAGAVGEGVGRAGAADRDARRDAG